MNLAASPVQENRGCPIKPNNAPVAQLDRVLGYEPSGREFESLRARHKIKGLADIRCWPFSFCRHFADIFFRPLAD